MVQSEHPTYRVFVAQGRPVVTADLPPDITQRVWLPTSSTFICGRQDAVVVDALLTTEDARVLTITEVRA